MVDTIHIRIDNIDISRLNPNIEQNQRVTNSEEEYKGMEAFIENIKLFTRGNSLYVRGSLSRFYRGNNAYTLSFVQLKAAIEELEEELGISLRDGVITRIDIAENIEVEYPVSRYFPYIGSTSRYIRNQISKTSLYFMQAKVALKMYDKIKEMKSRKNIVAPKRFKYSYLLRYELMLKYVSIRKILGRPMLVRDLLSISTYSRLVLTWALRYDKLHKLPDTCLDMEKIKAPKDICKYLMHEGLKSIGGLEGLKKLIDNSPEIKNQHNKFKQRVMGYAKVLENNDSFTKSSLLMEELDAKIELVCNHVFNELENYLS